MEESARKRRASSVPAPQNKRKLCLVLDYVEVPPLPARKRQKYEPASSVEARQTRSRTGKSPARAGKSKGTPCNASAAPRMTSKAEKDAQKPTPKRGRRASISGPSPTNRLSQLDIAPKPKRLPPRSRFRTESVSPVDEQPPSYAVSKPPETAEDSAPETALEARYDQDLGQTAPDHPTDESRGPPFSAEPISAPTGQQESGIQPGETTGPTSEAVMRSPRMSLATQIDLTPTQDTILAENDEQGCEPFARTDPAAAPPPICAESAPLPPPLVLPPTPPASSHAEYPRTQPPAAASLAPTPLGHAIAEILKDAHIPKVPLPPPLEEYVPSSKTTTRPPTTKTRLASRPLQKAKTESSLDTAHLNDFALDFAMLLPEYDGFLTSGARHIIHHMHHTLALESIALRRLEDQLSTEISLRCAVEREAERLRAELAELQEEAEERRARKQARRERRAAEVAARASELGSE
ncbi:hypothetical protein K523DRAFT_317986 [Schizophyllum commune Tattone D]|nr:hypothetical protein K523DRAFT_317986 [Schizophyllum commune Tattone D]